LTRRFGSLALLVSLPAWASHPLITENTSVLGKDAWELELHGERARDDSAGVQMRRSDVAGKLGYGIARNADLEVELPYVREVTGDAVVEGRGDASLSVKWRFHEKDGFSLAFKPSFLLPTGRDEVGLGAGRARWALNLAGACQAGKLELLAHLGYTQNRNRVGERSSLWHASAALLYSLTERLRLLADYGQDSRPDPAVGSHGREWVVGATYALSERIDVGFGLKKALNDAADDRALRAGVKLRW
jgi:predicted porin